MEWQVTANCVSGKSAQKVSASSTVGIHGAEMTTWLTWEERPPQFVGTDDRPDFGRDSRSPKRLGGVERRHPQPDMTDVAVGGKVLVSEDDLQVFSWLDDSRTKLRPCPRNAVKYLINLENIFLAAVTGNGGTSLFATDDDEKGAPRPCGTHDDRDEGCFR